MATPVTLFSPTMRTASFNLDLLIKERDKRLNHLEYSLRGTTNTKERRREAILLITTGQQAGRREIGGGKLHFNHIVSAGGMTLMCSLLALTHSHTHPQKEPRKPRREL